MGKNWKVLVVGISLVVLSGCTTRFLDFTVLSSKNVQLPRDTKNQRVSAQDCVPVVLFPIGQPNVKEAIDRAIESAGGSYDALGDGVIYILNQSFVIGRLCYRVEGTPIDTKASRSSLNEFQKKGLMLHSRR